MSFGARCILIRHYQRFGRLLAVLVTLPALVLGPLTTQAILIHDHHGHDTHGHAVTLRDLDDLQENSEHHHDKHDHEGRPVDPAEGEGTPILIVLDLPETIPGSRTSLGGAAVATGVGAAPRTLATNGCLVENIHPRVESQRTLANIPRARSLVTGILLTSHALLL